MSSVSYILLAFDVNVMSWYCVLYSLRHFINHIVPLSQFISGLCLTNQSYLKNMFVPFKSVTTTSILSISIDF